MEYPTGTTLNTVGPGKGNDVAVAPVVLVGEVAEGEPPDDVTAPGLVVAVDAVVVAGALLLGAEVLDVVLVLAGILVVTGLAVAVVATGFAVAVVVGTVTVGIGVGGTSTLWVRVWDRVPGRDWVWERDNESVGYTQVWAGKGW